MNKPLLAVLLLAITGSILAIDVSEDLNRLRQHLARNKGIQNMNNLTFSPELDKIAQKYCDKCTPVKDIKSGPGYKVFSGLFETQRDWDMPFPVPLSEPELTRFGFCHAKCPDYNKVLVLSSEPVSSSLPGLNSPGSSPDATTSSAMSTPVVFLAIALVFFGF